MPSAMHERFVGSARWTSNPCPLPIVVHAQDPRFSPSLNSSHVGNEELKCSTLTVALLQY